jgi:hypothetical protein
MGRIATDKSKLEIAEHERNCQGLRRVERQMDEMQHTQNDHAKLLAEFNGGLRVTKWVIPMLMALLSSSAAVALWRFLLGPR